MRDADRERLTRLAGWRPPHGVISAYFDIDRGRRSDAWRTWLKDELNALDGPDDREGKLAIRRTVERVLERFAGEGEPPPGRAQVGFVEGARKAGAEDWSSLQLAPRESAVAYGPRPLLLPLIDLLDRGRPRAVLAISAERVRGWIWSRGRLEPESAWTQELAIYEGRERKGQMPRNPSRGQGVSSSGHDQYGQRLEENRKRFVGDVARQLAEDARVRGSEVVAIGEAPHLDEFAAALPSTIRARKVEGIDVIGEPDREIAERVGAEIEAFLQRREVELTHAAIDAAMASEGRGVSGTDETSEALAEGRVERLLLDCGRKLALDDLSPPARQAVGDAGMLGAAELLVELALRSAAEVTLVGGAAAE